MSSLLLLTPALAAQQTDSGAAPVPPQLLDAHRVFVANGGGSSYFELFSGGPNRAYNTFYKELNRMRQYELVSSPGQADLIFEIRAVAPAVSGLNDTVSYNPQAVLTIRDPKTNVVLWTESANIRSFGTKQRRDRQFDQSVAVLVDKLAVVTGRPLTEAQTKAIAGNSKIPTGEKVLIVSGIVGATAMAAWGIHRISNPPQLTPPPVPTLP
ncbi:MAG: hypothetical protein WAM66_14915 [Acidobacteriaceae bacterium]